MDDPNRSPANAGRRAARGAAIGLLAAAALGVVLLALALAAALALSRGWERQRLLAALEAALGSALGAPVEIGSLSGPLYPEIVLRDVRVGPPELPLAEIDRLSLHWDAAALPSGGPLVVETLELDGLRLHVHADAEGHWNLPALSEARSAEANGSSAAALLPAVRVRAFRVVRSHLLLDSEQWQVGATGLPDDAPARLAASLAAEAYDVRVEAPISSLASGRLELVFEPSRLAAGRLEEGVLRASLDERRWLEVELRANGSFGRASLRGAGDLDGLLASAETRLEVGFEELDLGALTGRPEQTTRLTGAGSVQLGAPAAGGERELLADLTLEPSRIARIDIERGRLRGGVSGSPGDALADSRWHVDELELYGTGVALSGSGAGSAGTLERAKLSARIERLGAISEWLGAGKRDATRLGGSAELRLDLAGPAGQPDGRVELDARGLVLDERALGDLELRASVEHGRRVVLERFALRGGRFALAAEPGGVLRLREPDETGSASEPIALENLRLRSDGATLSLDGAIGAESVRSLRLRISNLALAPLVPRSATARLRAGRVDAALAIDGPFAKPRIEGSVELAAGELALAWLDEPLGPIAGRIQFEPGALIVERLSLGSASGSGSASEPGSAELSGRVALAGLEPGALDLRLSLDDFPLTRVPLLPPPDPNGAAPETLASGGHVDADLRVTGDARAPRLAGDLAWTRPRWQSLELDRITAHVEGDAGRVDGSLRVDYAGREVLVARFELPVPEAVDEPLDWLRDERARIDVDGDSIEFAMLAPFLTRLVRDPKGEADVELRIRGGTPEPRVQGTVRVADGSIRAPLLRQTFAPVSGTLHFDGRRVRLESLEVGPPEAGLRAEGSLELEDLRPARVDVAFTLSAFPFSRSSLLETNLDGELRLAGEVFAPALTGSLELQRTRVAIGSAQDPVYKEVRIRTATAADASMQERGAAGPGLLERASVDVELRVPGDSWIRSAEMELDVKGWGRIEKRSLEPARVSGSLEALRGTVRVVGKKFSVRSGRAEINGDAEIDPVLDVEATHPVADVLIVAHVTGRVSAPILRLTSEPEMEEPEVVSYLFFGRPTEQLGASQQGGVDLAAAGLAAGMALDELREIFGHSFPVDTVDLRLQEGDEPSKIEIGKYVTKDVFVRIGQSFGAEQTQEVGVSYRVDDHWRVESSTSSNAAAGADVFWTIDY